MIYFVYLLQSEENGSLYVGCASDLKKRITEHNNGESSYTKKYLPWKLIYFEGYCSKVDACQREKSLKLHAQGLRRLKERLCNSLRV